MAEDHWHYVSDIHGAAEEHHRHYDEENRTTILEEMLREARDEIAKLREELVNAERGLRVLFDDRI
jgi:hypothetical protein